MTTLSIYYILFDALSDVGGLLALLKSVIGVATPVVILVLLYDFSRIITRRSKQKVRIFELKDILRNLPRLRGILNTKIHDKKHQLMADQYKEDLGKIGDDSEYMKKVRLII